jgi:hypothetical protein
MFLSQFVLEAQFPEYATVNDLYFDYNLHLFDYNLHLFDYNFASIAHEKNVTGSLILPNTARWVSPGTPVSSCGKTKSISDDL